MTGVFFSLKKHIMELLMGCFLLVCFYYLFSSAVKTAIKKFDKALESKDEAAIEEAYTAAVSKVDKAVTKGVIHKNAANRKKAQLAKKHDAK